MKKEEILSSFLVLKEVIERLDSDEKSELCARAAAVNPWFTEASIEQAFDGICHLLKEDNFKAWVEAYPWNEKAARVGIIMAGNIPLVGFHDLLCTLVSGHTAIIKLSSQDEVLPRFIINELCEINPEIKSRIEVVDKLANIDAVIATGSDNSSRYFRKYFKDYPTIIRKNRTSIAVLNGDETTEDLTSLAKDIFSFFGMGCRNVSKLFVPEGYEMNQLLPHFEQMSKIAHHPKYFNNYEYNKAIYLVNKVEHLDNGFALFTESEELVSPLSVVYFEHYNSTKELETKLSMLEDKLQCVVGNISLNSALIHFGQAQSPDVDDYADNIDTMKFLSELKQG